MRVGTTTRAAGREEEEWLIQEQDQFPTWAPAMVDRWEFPEEAVREAVVNALVHRDYSIVGTDVMLVIFSDRFEVVSPGRLPNTVTPEGMRLGMRYARNQTLVNVMRDYGYVDARGMGVRNKIIPGMWSHNGTEPELIEGGASLYRAPLEGSEAFVIARECKRRRSRFGTDFAATGSLTAYFAVIRLSQFIKRNVL